MGGPRVYNINQLPHDIICYIFGFLTVGDACRARLSSSGWLHLPDSRAVLCFDSHNVLGKEIAHKDCFALQSKFVNIINRFLEVWAAGERMHTLVVRFVLGREHASHIDRWIATSARMEVEEIDLDFSGISQERYVFPSHVFHFGKPPHLKRLCLKSCTLTISSQCTSWSSNLTMLDLSDVPLEQRGIDFILSAGSNLISLGLFNCNLPRIVRIAGQHIRLKKLSICDTLFMIRLKCPDLEVFEYDGSLSAIMFSHVPVLREAKLWPQLRPGLLLLLLYRLTKQTPHLQVLSLSIVTEVEQLSSTLPSLKQLKISVPLGFDLLSITHLLDASPFLETLQIKLSRCTDITSIEKRKYRKCRHFHLKEVKIEGFHDQWNEMELAIYLLKYAVSLEQMVIELSSDDHLRLRWKVRTRLLREHKINPTARVIIM